jgi:hypothetical protein
MGSIHAYPNLFAFLDGTAEADFDLIEVDMNHFLAISADFRHLPVEIDRITATGTARNDNSDDLCLLLHDRESFQNPEFKEITRFGGNISAVIYCILS